MSSSEPHRRGAHGSGNPGCMQGPVRCCPFGEASSWPAQSCCGDGASGEGCDLTGACSPRYFWEVHGHDFNMGRGEGFLFLSFLGLFGERGREERKRENREQLHRVTATIWVIVE